jgi:hypothetical protein
MPEMPDFDEVTLAKLARERAMNVKNVFALFKEYDITEEQYYELVAHNPYFKRLLDQYTLDWNATTSTADRLKIESLATLEQLIPVAARMALNEAAPQPLAALTGFGSLLTKTAGIGDPKSVTNNAERFVIQINLGADTEKYDKTIEVTANDGNLKEIAHGQADSSPKKEDPFDFVWPAWQGQGTGG